MTLHAEYQRYSVVCRPPILKTFSKSSLETTRDKNMLRGKPFQSCLSETDHKQKERQLKTAASSRPACCCCNSDFMKWLLKSLSSHFSAWILESSSKGQAFNLCCNTLGNHLAAIVLITFQEKAANFIRFTLYERCAQAHSKDVQKPTAKKHNRLLRSSIHKVPFHSICCFSKMPRFSRPKPAL